MSKRSDRSKGQDTKIRQSKPDENIVAIQGKLYVLVPKGDRPGYHTMPLPKL